MLCRRWSNSAFQGKTSSHGLIRSDYWHLESTQAVRFVHWRTNPITTNASEVIYGVNKQSDVHDENSTGFGSPAPDWRLLSLEWRQRNWKFRGFLPRFSFVVTQTEAYHEVDRAFLGFLIHAGSDSPTELVVAATPTLSKRWCFCKTERMAHLLGLHLLGLRRLYLCYLHYVMICRSMNCSVQSL